jgi:hypothetical protein
MPTITRTPVTGYAHCAQQLTDGELSYDLNGVPDGEDRCEGYKQAPVAAIKEVTAWLFGDFSTGSDDAMDVALARNVSHSHERIVWADLDDAPCPFCGVRRELSDQVRPQYAPLGGPRGNADQLFADRRQRREQGQAVVKSADAADRQAAALEQANLLKERELDLRERELEAQQARAPLPATHRRRPAPKVPAEVE